MHPKKLEKSGILVAARERVEVWQLVRQSCRETRIETMMCGIDPNKGLVMHASCPVFKPKPPIEDAENLSEIKIKFKHTVLCIHILLT